VRQGRQSDRLIGELLTEQAQDATVNLVQTELVDSEERQTLNGDVLIDHVVPCTAAKSRTRRKRRLAMRAYRDCAGDDARRVAFSVTSSRPAID